LISIFTRPFQAFGGGFNSSFTYFTKQVSPINTCSDLCNEISKQIKPSERVLLQTQQKMLQVKRSLSGSLSLQIILTGKIADNDKLKLILHSSMRKKLYFTLVLPASLVYVAEKPLTDPYGICC
jgi:hypothetical protein